MINRKLKKISVFAKKRIKGKPLIRFFVSLFILYDEIKRKAFM